MTLTIKDFKRIEEADLEFKGITMIMGLASNGKSTMLKALKAVLTNQTSDRQFRYGTKGFEVKIGMGDKQLKYTRTKAGRLVTLYTGGGPGEEFKKLDKDTLAEIVPAFPLKMISLKDSKFFPNIVSQGQIPLFSQIDTTDMFSTMYEDVAKLTRRLDDLKKSLSLSNRELSDLDAQIRFCDEGVAKIEEQLKTLDVVSLDAYRQPLSDFLSMRDSLVATTSEVQALQDQLNDMADIEYLEKSAGLDKIQKALSRVDLASRPFTKQKDIASTLSELESRILRESGVVRSLEGIVGVSSRLYQAIPLADKVSRIATDLDSLDAIDTTLLPTVSDGDLKTLPQAISRLSQASPMVSRLAVIALASGPILSDLTKLTSLDVQLEKVHKILAREQILAEIDAVEDRIRDTIPEISQVLSDLSKIDICPVCGQHTNLSKAVQDGHFHG